MQMEEETAIMRPLRLRAARLWARKSGQKGRLPAKSLPQGAWEDPTCGCRDGSSCSDSEFVLFPQIRQPGRRETRCRRRSSSDPRRR